MTTVRTPHADEIWNKKGRKGFSYKPSRQAGGEQIGGRKKAPDDLTSEDCAEGFTPQRGTGQGDVLSLACWAAIFDILLTVLKLDEELTG